MSGLGGGGTACVICEKTAFPAETVSYEKKAYHIECFRCQETTDGGEPCGKKLDASHASGFEGKIYCKQCFDRGGFSQKQRNVKWTPKTSSGGGAVASKFGGGGTPCQICEKTVYPAEAVSYEKKSYHTDCFKCVTCEKKITAAGAASFENSIYCKKCFSSGGFAQKQRNVKWEKKETSGSAVASKFGGGGVKCEVCAKTVYSAEQVSYEKKAYHQECFTCTTCNKKQTPANAAAYENKIYCKKCFTEGGFTQKQRNVKWESKGSAGGSVSKFGGGGNKCKVCDKTVYPAETVSYEKGAYHADCFKCSECQKKCTPSTAAKFADESGEKLFCTKCFASGGYAKKQTAVKKNTSDAPKSYDNRFSKFGGGGNKCVSCTKTVYPAEQLSFEKNIFHIACFKCSHEGCSKGGKPISTSDAQYKKNDDGSITVYCKKCWGELGLNRS